MSARRRTVPADGLSDSASIEGLPRTDGVIDPRENFDPGPTQSSLRGDWGNVVLLTFLYVLQGIPLGLAGAIPMILQNRQVTYKQQAIFSLVNWPFSLKLLWAPLVDSMYISRMGRRKSWLVPTQYLIGVFMLLLSFTSERLFGEEGTSPNVVLITVVFFALCFLAATQDIAVDGWALTMLSRRNVGHASTCNCIGQTAGYFIGYVVFLALESKNFCNQYLRAEPKDEGLVTLSEFLYFWGIVYFITTSLVWFFKKENPASSTEQNDDERGVVDTFKILIRIMKLPAMKLFILLLLTMKMGFAAPDAITGLKLSEHGVPKDKLALLAIPIIPLQIFLPILISRFTAGPRPLDVCMKAYPYRLLFGLLYPLLVWCTPSMETSPGVYPYYFYALVLIVYALHQIALYSMFVSVLGFFAKISDPVVGGTYMTLLNTLSNLGGNWPATLSLFFVDTLTWKECVGNAEITQCSTDTELKACQTGGGSCSTWIDGYYMECILCTAIGFLWLVWGRHHVNKLQQVRESAWRTRTS